MMEEKEKEIKYNRLYEQLVCNAEDEFDRMAGMIAYGEYKWKKNKFFSRYCDKHKRNPDMDALDNFMLEFNDEETREELLKLARERLYSFAEQYIEDKREEILDEFEDTKIIRIISKNTAWWRGFVLSMFAAFAYSIMLAGITFSITMLNPSSQVAQFILSLVK